jgi:outer membrane protein assembly factor BamD
MKRGAYVAAIQRAKNCVDQYDGAPAVHDAVAIMVEGYDRLNLQPLAEKAKEVYRANYTGEVRDAKAEIRRSWWQIF